MVDWDEKQFKPSPQCCSFLHPLYISTPMMLQWHHVNRFTKPSKWSHAICCYFTRTLTHLTEPENTGLPTTNSCAVVITYSKTWLNWTWTCLFNTVNHPSNVQQFLNRYHHFILVPCATRPWLPFLCQHLITGHSLWVIGHDFVWLVQQYWMVLW